MQTCGYGHTEYTDTACLTRLLLVMSSKGWRRSITTIQMYIPCILTEIGVLILNPTITVGDLPTSPSQAVFRRRPWCGNTSAQSTSLRHSAAWWVSSRMQQALHYARALVGCCSTVASSLAAAPWLTTNALRTGASRLNICSCLLVTEFGPCYHKFCRNVFRSKELWSSRGGGLGVEFKNRKKRD